ncbi:MAG: PQQ-binding-like beta-propeller repeat protein, partial [Planctomycetota bacterium]|nr:PQQ-binding-like beta-propeller repeat protein [Planctomycetota bacterium]
MKEEIPEVAVETRKGKRFYFGDQAVVSSATVEVVRGAMALARAGQHEPAVQRLQEALSSEGELLFSDTNEPARVVSLANSIQALVATDPELSRAYETSYAAPARSRFDEAMHYYTGGYAMTSLGHFARLEREYPLSSYSRKARLLQAGLYADIGKTAHAQHLLSQAADDPLTPVADRATALVWQAALDERSARESKKRMAPLLRELKPDAGFLRAGRKITFADWADLKDRVKTSRPRQTAMPAAGKLVADIEIRAKSHADRSYPDAVGSAVVFYDGQTVRCFDTDKLEWRWEAAGPGSGFPTGTPGKPVPLATTENRVFVTLGLADGWGTLVAFDLTLGEAYWSTKYQGSYAGLTFVSPPSILDDRLFVLARDARSGAGFNETLLLCIDAATGENIWRKALVSGSIGGAERMLPGPLAFGGSVGVFVHTGHWMTIDVETGEYQGIYTCRSGGWSFSNISGRSLATSQLTILLTGNGKLLAVDNLANSVRWLDDRSGISRLIGLAGDRLIYSAGDRVRAVDSKTGLLHWEVATAPGQSAEAILHGGSLRVAGVDGNQLQIDVSTGEVKKLNVPIYRGPGVVAGDGIVRVWRDGLTATRPKVTLPPAQHWKRTAMVHLVKRVVRNDEGYDRSRDLKELFTKGGQPEKALAHLLTMEDARRSGDQALAKASTRALLGMSKDVMTLSDGRIISPAVSGRLFDSFPKKTDAPVLETDSTGALVPLWSVPGAGITAGPNPDGTFVAIRRGTQVQLRLADERGSLVWARNFEDVPSIYWARSRLLILVGKELHSLDLRDSSMIWRRENCERIFVHPSSSVVVTQEGGKILGIDSASGEQLWDVEHAGVLHGHHFRDTFVLVSSGLRVLDVQTGGTRLQTGLALRKPDFTEDVPVLMHRDGNSIFCVRGDRGRAIEYDVERKRLVWSKVLRRMDGTSRLMSDENFFVISSDFASAARVAVIDRQKSGMFLSDQPSASAVSLNQGIIAYERFSGLGLMEVKSGYRPRLKRNVKHVLPGNAYRNFIIDENWVVTSRRGTGQWHFCLYRPQDIRITSQFALRDLPQSFAICGGLLLVGTPSDLVAFAAPEEKGIAPSTALEKAARAAGDAGEIAREMIAAKKPGEVDLFVTSTEIKPDGNLSDWQGLPVLKFGGNHYNALPPSTVAEPSREHRGDKDLSAEISICEDERSVFIGAAIRDDIHRPAHTWPLGSGDCLHVEMASAVGEEGARTIQRKAWTFVVDGEKSLMSAEPSSEIRFAGRRQGDKTIYEAAIPHSLAGSMTFLNITASDRDGRRVHGITSLAPVRPTSPGRRYYAVVKRINDVVGSADRSWKLLKLFPEANDAPRLVETIVRLIPSANPFDQMVKVHRDAIAIYPGSRWTPHFLSRIEASLQAKGVANGIDGTLKTAQSLKVPKVALDLYQAAPRLSQRMWIDKHQPTHRLEVRLMEDRAGIPITWGRIYWSPRPDVPSPVDAVYMGKLPAEGKWNTLTANLLALPQKSSKVGGIT